MKDLKNENIEKKKKAEQDKQNMKIGAAMGQLATGFVAASAIYASKEAQTADDNANNTEKIESLLAEAVVMPGEQMPFDNANTSDNERQEEIEKEAEENTLDASIPFEEDLSEDFSEKTTFVAATIIEDEVQQEQDAPFALEAKSISDDDPYPVPGANEEILNLSSVVSIDESSETDAVQDEILADEEVPSETFIADEGMQNETAEVESEIVLEFEDYEAEELVNVEEVEAELSPEIDYEDETALEVENEVVSVVQDEEVDLEFEDYVDDDDEYESVSVLFDEDEENTLLSYEDNLEASRSGEDGIIDDDSELSDFENNADVSSFM